ncbi:hypothetical protein [Opitutus terrae]|uniref:hypothetical protein n=1 Tax=Opitutus terrae TaxID=107709 RepID=UPI0003222BBC|nr:hypothetical protein [Opitutus terrae]
MYRTIGDVHEVTKLSQISRQSLALAAVESGLPGEAHRHAELEARRLSQRAVKTTVRCNFMSAAVAHMAGRARMGGSPGWLPYVPFGFSICLQRAGAWSHRGMIAAVG